MLAEQPRFIPPLIYRRLRAYANDPSLAQQFETARISEVVLRLPWEWLKPGPVGEYLEVIDYDPAGKCFYEPVSLDDPRLLAQDGLRPSEGTPQFHQQMVYAVAQLTIGNFERALGRRALWSPCTDPDYLRLHDASGYVGQLRIYPHALREPNAYYSPAKKALLFGYFSASADPPADHVAGSMVFSCLSHDIIAHETTHALLDGVQQRMMRATNPDVLAFHEAFADIVALFQHFTFPEILYHEIARSRGDFGSQETLLGELAGQFGRATGARRALREAIGTFDPKTKRWKRHKIDPTEYGETFEPHQRGAILVAAVFDAFLAIYRARVSDLLRLATGGSGVLPAGALHPDLVRRLGDEAIKAADHVLTMCVRALDYCPPVDLTFGEYLRALITADADIVPDDDRGYRVAFAEAFRGRGLFPRDVRTLSVQDLIWRSPGNEKIKPSDALRVLLGSLREFGNWQLYAATRERLFCQARRMRIELEERLKRHCRHDDDDVGKNDRAFLGLSDDPRDRFEVRSLHFSRRVGPDGDLLLQAIVQIIQEVPRDVGGAKVRFEGGCTLIVDLEERDVKYCIRKPVTSATRARRQHEVGESDIDEDAEPFALLHRGGD